MSLLTRKAPHTVLVQKRETTLNAQGIRFDQNVGEPIPVRCMVEPVRDWSSSEEVESLGLQVVDLGIIRSQKWPGDIKSHVMFEGALYETVGAPQRHSVSRRTGHYRVTIKWLRTIPEVT